MCTCAWASRLWVCRYRCRGKGLDTCCSTANMIYDQQSVTVLEVAVGWHKWGTAVHYSLWLPDAWCVLIFDVFHGTAPIYLTDICSRCSDSRLRSSARDNFVVRRTRTRFADSSFAVAAGPGAWNSLPVNIRNIGSHSAFCRHLKTYLFTVPDWITLLMLIITIVFIFYVFFKILICIVRLDKWASSFLTALQHRQGHSMLSTDGVYDGNYS